MNTMEQCKKFEGASETAVRLMLRYPWFMGLYYSMNLYELPGDGPYTTLCTNGVSMWIHRGFWDQLNRDQRMTAVAHEMGHKMYLHTTRCGDRNKFVWNIAGDHRINLDLVASGFTPLENLTINGKPWSWCCDKKYADDAKWTTEAIYDDIYKELEKKCGKGGDVGDMAKDIIGDAFDIGDFGRAPDGSKDETEGAGGKDESPEQFEQRVRKELRESEQQAKIAGNCPAWMKRMIANADNIKVNWFDVLEQFMRALVIADYSWARFSRREWVKTGVLSPDMYTPAMGGVVLFVDCSGSTSSLMGMFLSHFKDIIEQVKPKWVDVRYFETQVNHSLDERFERGDVDVKIQPYGGGGTAVHWLADEIEALEEKPEVALVLTDMYVGDMGREPDLPVVWLSASDIVEAKYGSVISIR